MLGILKSGRLKDQQLAARIILPNIKHSPMLDAWRHTLSSSLSLWDTSVGNLPALFRPGPRRRGICLITASEARKAAYFLAVRQGNICQRPGHNEHLQSSAGAHTASFTVLVCKSMMNHIVPGNLTELLDELLVFLQLLQILHTHLVDANSLGLLTVLVVSQHAHLHLRPWCVRQLDGAAETLILLWVIILESNLELDRFCKLSLLGLATLQNSCGCEQNSPV